MDNYDMTNFVPQNGMEVFGSDGEKIGDIDAVERDYFIVRKGFFFPQDHYIPLTAIASYDEDRVYLNVTKDGALEQDWSNAPVVDSGYVENTGETWGQGTIENDVVVDRDVNYTDRDYADVDRRRDDGTIEVVEEDLAATKREVERGRVGIHKDVVEEQKTIDVPVREEEVNVTRRRVDRPVDGHEFEEGTIEVPLKGEEVDVQKTARVVEEIDIDKTAVEKTQRVSDTVRREEVRIDGENIDVDRNADYTDRGVDYVDNNVDYVDGDVNYRDDRSLIDKAKDAVDTDDDGKLG